MVYLVVKTNNKKHKAQVYASYSLFCVCVSSVTVFLSHHMCDITFNYYYLFYSLESALSWHCECSCVCVIPLRLVCKDSGHGKISSTAGGLVSHSLFIGF